MTLKEYMKQQTENKLREVVEQNVSDWGGTRDYDNLDFEDLRDLPEDLIEDDTLFKLIEQEYLIMIYEMYERVQGDMLAELEDQRAVEQTYESMRGTDV